MPLIEKRSSEKTVFVMNNQFVEEAKKEEAHIIHESEAFQDQEEEFLFVKVFPLLGILKDLSQLKSAFNSYFHIQVLKSKL
jgi:hypothetical protein